MTIRLEIKLYHLSVCQVPDSVFLLDSEKIENVLQPYANEESPLSHSFRGADVKTISLEPLSGPSFSPNAGGRAYLPDPCDVKQNFLFFPILVLLQR